MSYTALKIIALVFIILLGISIIFFIEECIRHSVVLSRKRRFYYTLYTTDRQPVLLTNRQPEVRILESKVTPKPEPQQNVTTKKVIRRKVQSTTTGTKPQHTTSTITTNRTTSNAPKRVVSKMAQSGVSRETPSRFK